MLTTDHGQITIILNCIAHYTKLAQDLRRGVDVSETLQDEFYTGNLFQRITGGWRGRWHCPHEPPSTEDYRATAEMYLSLGPGTIETETLLRVVQLIILEHWRILSECRTDYDLPTEAHNKN